MALFGCGRDDRGGMAGVGVFAASAALDRLLGVDAKDEAPHGTVVGPARLLAVPAKAPAPAPSRAPSSTRASPSNGATPSWRPCRCSSRCNEGRPTRLLSARRSTCTASRSRRRGRRTRRSPASPSAHSFQLARKVLRPQFDLIKAARPRPFFPVSFSAVVRLLASLPCEHPRVPRIYEAAYHATDATWRKIPSA